MVVAVEVGDMNPRLGPWTEKCWRNQTDDRKIGGAGSETQGSNHVGGRVIWTLGRGRED